MSTAAYGQETRRVDVGFQGRVLHDSNITRSSSAAAAVSGIKQADTIYSPGLSFDVLLPLSRQSFFLRGSAGYDFYQKNTGLNKDRYDLDTGLNVQAGPCVGQVAASYFRGQSNLQDVSLLVSENALETKAINASVSCARPSGLGITGSAGKEWSENSNEVRIQSDSETMNGTLGVVYDRPSLGALSVFGSMSETKYPNRTLIGGGNGFDSRSLNVSFERRISTRLQGLLRYGYAKVEPSESPAGGGGDFSGSTYGGDLTYRPTSRLTSKLSFDREITPSNGFGGLYAVSSVWRLTGAYELGSRIILSVGAESAKSDARGLIPLGVVALTNSDSTAGFGAVQFVQSERISWVLDARREERDTNAPQFDYSRTVVSLTTNVAF